MFRHCRSAGATVYRRTGTPSIVNIRTSRYSTRIPTRLVLKEPTVYICLNAGAIGIDLDLDRRAHLAKKIGYAAIDVSLEEIHEYLVSSRAADLEKMMSSAGIVFGSAGLPVRWNGDEATYREDLAKLPVLLESGRSAGISRISQWIPSVSDTRKFRSNFRWHIERLKPIADLLAQYGFRLGLEFLGPRHLRLEGEYGFISTVGGMLGFCEAIGAGNVGLLLDAFHWFTGYGTIADLLTLTNDDIVNVHLNDAIAGVAPEDQNDDKRELPGDTGVIDLAGFLKALDEVGYDGPVAAEPFSERLSAMPPEKAAQLAFDSIKGEWKAASLS